MKINAAILPLAIPSVAYASGGDILSLMWIELGLFIAILIFSFASKLALKYRATIFFTYVISVAIAIWLTSSMPYLDNLILINSTNFLLPIIACICLEVVR
ncbi:hypothetical protein [Undibacterium flavidum]|uniref:Uncharacterized protein n=1 Tax=Undibacterium flavidum TaxID=2762297 RepID=A0ABR6Y7J1_9BURK|nr:hypothetical protein [Undibacterium flavidum]MBC3872584.1 hypothetical protein [Undibacterium flavidum]